MSFYAKIGSSERIFLSRKVTAYYVNHDEKHYFYNVSFNVDAEKALNQNLDGINLYLSEKKLSTRQSDRAPDLFSSVKFEEKHQQVAARLGYERANIMHEMLHKANHGKTFLNKIRYTHNIDYKKYKENINGSDLEKFGTETQRRVKYEMLSNVQILDQRFDEDSSNTKSSREQNRRIGKSLFIEGVSSGKGMIDIMNYNSINSKSVLDSHVITAYEQNIKDKTKSTKSDAKSELMKVLNEYFSDKIGSKRKIPKIAKENVSRKNLKMNVEVAIPKSLLQDNVIPKDAVRLTLEAKDITDTYVLDTIFVDLDITKDLVYSTLTLDGLSLNSTVTSNKEVCFKFASNGSVNTRLDVHYNYIAKFVPIFQNNFNKIKIVDLESHGPRASHELLLTRRSRSSTNTKSTYQMPISDTPHIVRCTPTINSVSIDNCLETSVATKGKYQINFISFYVTCVPSTEGSGQGYMNINLTDGFVDSSIKKIRPVKINLTKHPYGGSKYYEPIRNKKNEVVDFSVTAPDRKISFRDFDVEINDTYEYRLQIIRKNSSTTPEYTDNSFTEKHTYAKRAIDVSVNPRSSEASGMTVLDVSCKFNKNDIQAIFEAAIGDKFDLFQEEISELKEASTPVVALLCEKINSRTGEVQNLGLKKASSATESQARFRFEDATPNTGDCFYKFTPSIAPMAELISTLNNEIVRRFDLRTSARSGVDYFNFTGLKKKLSLVNENVLSTLSTKFTTAGMISNKLIVDPETIAAQNNGDIMRSASTGDVFYYYNSMKPNPAVRKRNQKTGFESYKKTAISYYQFSERNKMTENKFNNSMIRHKFIIDIQARFNYDIDHCTIFSVSEGKVKFECVLHVDYSKSLYRALIERERCYGTTQFYAFPVSKEGRILSPKHLGNFRK